MKLYPLGHPIEIVSDSEAVHEAAHTAWHHWTPLFCTTPLKFEIETHPGPAPLTTPNFEAPRGSFRLWSGGDNTATFDFATRTGRARISADLAAHPNFRHHYLIPLVLTALDSVYFTPLHAACVARDNQGILLCGDSGAGKSTLAYACARQGWTFICDDVVHLTPGRQRIGVGGSQRIHLREPARALFPELERFQTATAPNGKQAIEIDAAQRGFQTARHVKAAKCVFLNRRPGPACLRPHPQDAAISTLLNALVPRDTTNIKPRLEAFLSTPPQLLEYENLEDAVALLNSL